MTTALHVTEEELTQLHLLVSQEMESSRVELDHVELHHSSSVDSQEYLKQRLEHCRTLLHKIDAALPAFSGQFGSLQSTS